MNTSRNSGPSKDPRSPNLGVMSLSLIEATGITPTNVLKAASSATLARIASDLKRDGTLLASLKGRETLAIAVPRFKCDF